MMPAISSKPEIDATVFTDRTPSLVGNCSIHEGYAIIQAYLSSLFVLQES